MSKRTKRIGLALLLLSLGLGGATLYLRRNSSSDAAKQASAGHTSISIEAVPTPIAAPPPAAPVVVKASLPAPHRVTAAAPEAGNEGVQGRGRREPRNQQPRRSAKTLAMVEPSAAAHQTEGAAAGAAAVPQERWGNIAIQVRPRLGDTAPAFAIVKVAAFVDGRQVSELDGTSFGQRKAEIQAWNGAVTTGEHVLNIVVEYHGNGHSVFSYFDGYRYTARSSTLFRIQEGIRLDMIVDLLDRGGVNTPFEQRLTIAFAKR